MRYSKKGIHVERNHFGTGGFLKWDSSKRVHYKHPMPGSPTQAVRHTRAIREQDLWTHDSVPSPSGLQIGHNDVGKLLVVDEMPNDEFIDYIVDAGRALGAANPEARDYLQEAINVIGYVRVGDPQSFWVHKELFRVSKSLHGRGYYLSRIDPHTGQPKGDRNRGGTKAQIIEDIAHVLEYGTLPPPSGPRW